MNRELRITGDGSHTMYVSDMDESYHSKHGALQESVHIFIRKGFQTIDKSPVHILELGLGTGLNVMLTLAESEKSGSEVFYHAVEKYPLNAAEFGKLNYEAMIAGLPAGSLIRMHEAPWGIDFNLSDHFRMFKEHSDFRSMDPEGRFDLVYFDAFAPDKQPELWTREIFSKLFALMEPGAILVSYSSKGEVRRVLNSCGFEVRKIPGPPGKREMIQAIRR